MDCILCPVDESLSYCNSEGIPNWELIFPHNNLPTVKAVAFLQGNASTQWGKKTNKHANHN